MYSWKTDFASSINDTITDWTVSVTDKLSGIVHCGRSLTQSQFLICPFVQKRYSHIQLSQMQVCKWHFSLVKRKENPAHCSSSASQFIFHKVFVPLDGQQQCFNTHSIPEGLKWIYPQTQQFWSPWLFVNSTLLQHLESCPCCPSSGVCNLWLQSCMRLFNPAPVTPCSFGKKWYGNGCWVFS